MEDQESHNDLTAHEISKKVENGEFILKDKKGRSKAWLIFAEITTPDGETVPDYVFCKTCKNAYRYGKQTSNLVRHRCYIEEVSIIIKEENSCNLATSITRWLIKECHSYDLIHSENLKAVFQEFARLGSKFGGTIDFGKLLPSSSNVTNNVEEIYKQCLDRLKAAFSSLSEQGVGLTIAIRCDDLTRQSFVVLTVHYIKNGSLRLNLLGLRKLEGEGTTNQDINSAIRQILEDYNCKLSSKLILVADSCNSLHKTVTDVRNLPCISHLLAEVLFKCMAEIPEILEIKKVCTNLVNFLIKEGHETILYERHDSSYQNPWLTAFKRLNSIENKWNDIENILTTTNEKERFSSLSVNGLKAIIQALQPFEEAIETLEDDSSPNLHLVIVYLHELKKSCDIADDSEFQDFEFIQQLKKNLRLHLEKIMMENITILHKIALFLYPPTNKLLQFNSREKQVIENECMCLMQNYKRHEDKPEIKLEPDTSFSSYHAKRMKLFSDFTEPEEISEATECFSQEILLYKSTRVRSSPDFNLFNWWQLQNDSLPYLYKLSCTVLATPATCAASKRFLFKANYIKMTKEADIEKYMFINANAENDDIDINVTAE